MRSEKTSQAPGIGVGSSSILMVFVVLCLTAFATLSMVSARADYRLTQRSAANTAAYYEADAQAEERLAQLGALVDTLSPQELPAGLEAAGFVPEDGPGPLTVCYDIPMPQGKRLHVKVEAATQKRLCWQVQAPQESAGQDGKGELGKIGNLPIL